MTNTTTIAHGTAAAFNLAAGDRLTISTPAGAQGGDLSFLGFDQDLTRDILGFARHRKAVMAFTVRAGEHLYDSDNVPVLLVESVESVGEIDAMMPGCRHEIYEDHRPGCRDLISAALKVERARLTGMVSFWTVTHVTADYYDALSEYGGRPGDSLTVRAVRPVTVGVSACPDDVIPGHTGGVLEVLHRPSA